MTVIQSTSAIFRSVGDDQAAAAPACAPRLRRTRKTSVEDCLIIERDAVTLGSTAMSTSLRFRLPGRAFQRAPPMSTTASNIYITQDILCANTRECRPMIYPVVRKR